MCDFIQKDAKKTKVETFVTNNTISFGVFYSESQVGSDRMLTEQEIQHVDHKNNCRQLLSFHVFALR